MKLGSTISPPKLPMRSEPDARGTDASDLARLAVRMDALADEQATAARAVTEAADVAAVDVAAEAKAVDEINAQARAIEMDNHTRLTRLLLRDATYGTGAFVLGRLFFGGQQRARKHKGGQ